MRPRRSRSIASRDEPARSKDRGWRSARRARRAVRREGMHAPERGAGARRSTAAGGLRRRASRSRPAGSRRASRRRRACGLLHLLVGGVRCAEPDVVGNRAAEQGRALRHPGDLGAPCGRIAVREVETVDEDSPVRGLAKARAGAMPACSCRHRSARRARRSRPAESSSATSESGRGRPAGIRERDTSNRIEADRRVGGRSCRPARRPAASISAEQPVGDGDAVGARMESGREIAQRQVELRREHEHGQRRLERDPALDQPNADGDGDERDTERRRELEHGSREECEAKRSHRRRAVVLARLARSARSGPRRG